MKTKIVKVLRPAYEVGETVYMCEYCGKESTSQDVIYDCERAGQKAEQSECLHTQIEYGVDIFTEQDSSIYGGELTITQECGACGLTLASVKIYEDDFKARLVAETLFNCLSALGYGK